MSFLLSFPLIRKVMAMANRSTSIEDKSRGNRLKQARELRGLSQKDVADALGVTPQAYQNYEYGREIRSSAIVALCTLLQCSPSWLLGLSEDGEDLPDGDPLLVSLRETFVKLNSAGKLKITDYARDIACNPSYGSDVE